MSFRPVLGSTKPHIRCVPGALSPGVKRPGREADHSPPTSTEVKKSGSIYPLPYTPSWRSTYLVKYSDNFTSLISSSGYRGSNGRMIAEWRIGSDLEVSGRRLIKLVLCSFQEWLRQTSNKTGQDSRSPGLESNRVLPKLGVMSSPGAQFGLALLLVMLLQNSMPDCISLRPPAISLLCVYVSMVTSSSLCLKKVTDSSSEPMTDVYFHSADGVENTGSDLSRRQQSQYGTSSLPAQKCLPRHPGD
jgi:hypothetical protein